MKCPKWFAWMSMAVALAGGPGACRPDVVPPEAPRLVACDLDQRAGPLPPTAPIALGFSTPLDADSVSEDTVVLVRGAADEELQKALDKPPLPDALRDRVAPARVALDPDGLRVTVRPVVPLDAEALHALVVTRGVRAGGERLARAEVRAFRTGAAATGVPWWNLDAPLGGAIDVVRNLREIRVRFSRAVRGVGEGSLRLVDDDDRDVPIDVRYSAADSYRLEPRVPLGALRSYRVVAGPGVRDDDDQPPFDLDPPPGFTTGIALRRAAPELQDVKLVASSGCLVARWWTAVASDARLCVDVECAADPATVRVHELALPLPAGAVAAVTLSSRDDSTAPAGVLGPLPAPASSPRMLTLTEVLAHPRGARLAQQFVEVRNRGAAPVTLGGLELADDSGQNVLPDAILAAGAWALIVSADFIADDGVDARVADGTLVVRVAERHLGGNGIRESGEVVVLREPDGRLVSQASTVGLKLQPGQSARRRAACDVTDAWEGTTGAEATPGWE